MVFKEEEKAHTEEPMEAIEFPDNADEFHDEIYEVDEKNQNKEINDSPSQENSKSRDSIPFSVVTSESAL